MPTRSKPSLAVIIPSRLQRIAAETADGEYFVERAMGSVLAQPQVANEEVTVHFLIGIDDDASVPKRIAARKDLSCGRSAGRSQAAALNACIELVSGRYDYVAFLEDDDRWDAQYLTWALTALGTHDFVSSTQLEVDEADLIIRVNDFPTPSGWMMPVSTLQRVGPFYPSFRWHLDNDWLGRLAESGLRRCHMVEITAPTTMETSHQVRPWITNVLRFGGPSSAVTRHPSVVPLVVRLVHSRSGMAMINVNPVFAAESAQERDALVQRFGRIPW